MVWSSSGDYALSMPSSPLWVGTVLALQGFRVDSVAGVPAIVPLNALELTLGY